METPGHSLCSQTGGTGIIMGQSLLRGGHGGHQRVAWEPARAPASCFGCKQNWGQSVQGRLGAWEKETAGWDVQSASVNQAIAETGLDDKVGIHLQVPCSLR